MKLVTRILASIAAIFLLQYLLPQLVSYNTPLDAALTGLALGQANTYIRPFLRVLTFPLTFFTFGLSSLLINILLVLLVGYIIPGINLSGFGAAFVLAITVAILQAVIGRIFKELR